MQLDRLRRIAGNIDTMIEEHFKLVENIECPLEMDHPHGSVRQIEIELRELNKWAQGRLRRAERAACMPNAGDQK